MNTNSELSFVFDGSFDGFLMIVYIFYYEKKKPSSIVSEDSFQQSLATEYVFVKTDFEKAQRVYQAIQNISVESAENLYKAFLNNDENKYMEMFFYALLIFQKKKMVDHYIQIECVIAVQKLAKAVASEAHMFKGVCRFSETEDGIYYAQIKPRHNVLPLLAEHFIDRLHTQCFIIHDLERGIAVLYDRKQWIISQVPHTVNLHFSEKEMEYRRMWKNFVEIIAVENRVSKKRQNSVLPKRFRGSMIEFL